MLRVLLNAALRRPFVTLLVLVVAGLALTFGLLQLTQPDSPAQATTTNAYQFDAATPGAAKPAYPFEESVAGANGK